MSKDRTRYWAGAKDAVLEYQTMKRRKKTGQLQESEQKDCDAVEMAIRDTLQKDTGEERMEIIRLMYWAKMRCNIAGAALRVHCSEATAKRWHGEFIRQVLRNRGLLD